MFNTIIVPLDGSPAAEAILPALRAFVGDRGSEWIVLRAAERNGLAEADRYVRDRVESLRRDGICATGRVGEGPAADVVLDAARDADLIAMCTHGRSGPTRWVFGSVTESVLRDAPVPMLVVRERSRAAPPRRVLVPVDRAEESRDLLATAARLAHRFGARLTLLHVGERADETLDAAREILGPLPAPAETARPHPAPDPATAILNECARLKCDLVAMCTRGRSGVPRLVLGSCAESVMRNTGVPILIVRRSPAEAPADRFRPA